MSGEKTKTLLGGFKFVSRTFEGTFRDNPFVLDADANLFIGPADYVPRDEHASLEVIYHFLCETDRVVGSVRDLLRDRVQLLEAFSAFDDARAEGEKSEFRVLIFGTYDGDIMDGPVDDNLPAGPCGKTVNEIKRRLYELCRCADEQFSDRDLDERHTEQERQFIV
ncbi:MAG: hypothetical protein K0U93_01035 [Gammaproteobacteria bacterium]|nr:hypothetical protein [Gammaproteobacteria bacterium]